MRDDLTEVIQDLEKVAYKPRTKRVIKRRGLSAIRNKIKNRIKYRKNKYKLKMYNRKYRQKNKMQLKRKRQMRNKLKRFKS